MSNPPGLIEDDGVEREVNAADQADINAFSKLNLKYHELDMELKAKKEELENLQDCSNEVLMMLDDTEAVKLSVGEAYVDLSQDDAQEYITKMIEECEESVSKYEGEISEVKGKMSELKARLSLKFGKSINLEEDED
mmetsp:Transcript_26929/g.42077  ORF Transcript_26929/g.42077 Transcript_26929/m.42077 type:complete len:137 (+) Transcript_26929:32-442(+)|eukprot:CAMPEP_0184309164 /NCGR_PEP_ID=MMETSP1049-20130417/17416_1 /TAXON_ID=77928 /ORGANISM="Proteomonas sulcata, Strain CCMP704" /LENGTH=136 /DNA_ID=CAMNT_0026622005 /DNA_START=27 /DNA_END=437 /DNA_ORIENTATION=+